MSQTDIRHTVFQEFIKSENRLKAFVYTICHDWTVAEDSVQEAFMFVSEHWEDFRPGTNAMAWFRSIAHNRCREILASRKKHGAAGDLVDELIDERVWDESGSRLRLESLQRCLAKLSEASRYLLELHYWQRKKCEEIATVCGIKVDAVYARLSRTRRQLLQCMEQQAEVS